MSTQTHRPPISTEEAAIYIGMAPRTLSQWRADKDPKQPKYLKLGSKVAYRPSDLDAWLESCEVAI